MCTAKDAPAEITMGFYDCDNISGRTPVKPVAQPEVDGDKPRSYEIDNDAELVKTGKASGMVVFGAFVAGSLVGIIICAPAFVVVILGAGVAGLCMHDSKAGDVARKVGGFGANAILAIVKMGRQLDSRFKIADKTKNLAREASMKIQQADENHGFSKNIKAWAASLWSHIEQNTAPNNRPPAEQQLDGAAPVTDGTQLPFELRQQT